MTQGLLHLIGDYLLQNDWIAENKTKYTIKGYLACLVHCILYTLSFWLFLKLTTLQLILIFGSHFIIDKYRLAILWCRLKNWNWYGTNFGYEQDKPKWMTVWLVIIVDNTFHLICNYFIIQYFNK